MIKFKPLLLSGLIALLAPSCVYAGNYTLPIDFISDSDIFISAYFDHDSSGAEVYYDGTSTYDYNNHHGIDYGTTVEEKEIYAAADGIVRLDGWENPSDFTQGYGYRIYLYHSDYDQRTVYAHGTTTVDYVDVSDTVSRGDTILLSGDTGDSSGPHLHFGVYTGDSTSSADQTDPYGWSGGGTDPWPNTQGYLWTTDPPSFTPPAPATTTVYISGNITATTTWTTGNVYVINDGNYSVSSGATLYVEPGVVIKFSGTYAPLTINGSLEAVGSSTDKIYFTSLKDDTVGGDTNADGSATSPAAGDWNAIKIGSSGMVTLSDAVVRYGGGYSGYYGSSYTNINNYGGILEITDTEISSADTTGVIHTAGTTTINTSEIHSQQNAVTGGSGYLEISSSTIRDNATMGIQGSGNMSLSLYGNSFLNNDQYPAYVNFSGGLKLDSGNNTSNGSDMDGILMSGSVANSQTLRTSIDLPYILTSTLTIPNGTELTLEQGAIIKFLDNNSYLLINSGGTLTAAGTASSSVYLTSIHDDLVGGDTNNNGSTTSPSPGDWYAIRVNSGGDANLTYANIAYGGGYHGLYGTEYTNIVNYGGTLDISESVIRNASQGIRQYAGTTDIQSSAISDNDIGIVFWNDSLSVATSTFSGNSSYGIYNNGSTQISAENNYWDDSSGPYHVTLNPLATGDRVSNNVDFTPWLTSAP